MLPFTKVDNCARKLPKVTVAQWLTRLHSGLKVASSSLLAAFIKFSLSKCFLFLREIFCLSSVIFSLVLFFTVDSSFCFIFLHEFSWMTILNSKIQYPTKFTH